MKIAELEAHHDAYVDSERTIKTMVGNGEFPAVFSVCIDSFPHIVPAINYRKKKDIPLGTLSLLPITTICQYAPPLFEHDAIESLAKFVSSARVLALSEKGYLHSVEAARKRERLAHTLWNHLEKQPGTLQRDIRTVLGVIQEEAVEIIELWEELGVIDRQPKDESYRLYFRTQFNTEVEGLCQNCGVRGKGRKELFLKSVTCQKCGTLGYYHIDYRDSQ
jgi:hypothetical protein